MKKLKKDRVKRSRIILSSILTIVLALLSLAFGAYFGYVTLNINYITIGTMTPMIGGLLVVAGFFIFFGSVGLLISLKEIIIAFKNEDKFSAYKSSLISGIVYYVIIAIISIVGLIMSLASYIPPRYKWTIFALSILALLICAGAFYCVLKELKEHKKKNKKKNLNTKQEEESEEYFANMHLSPKAIHKVASLSTTSEQENLDFIQENKDILGRERTLKQLENDLSKKDIDFVILAEKLMQLEELRKAGLINDQEYQTLKNKCIT